MISSTDGKLLPGKRILVIRYRFIGDTILTGPFLKNLRAAYKDAVIDVLVGPQSGEVLTGCPYVNELIEFDTTRFHKYDSGSGATKSFWSYVHLLRARKYDLVFVLKRSWSSAVLALLTGAAQRVGYANQGRQILLTRSVAWNSHQHEVQSTLDVLRCAGIPIVDDALEGWVSDQEQSEIRSLVPQLVPNQNGVLIHAAAAHPDKIYPSELWAKVIQRLHERFQLVPYFTGAARDVELYEQLQQLSGVAGVNLAGKLSLRQSMALYKNMQLAVCVDSGPAHLAAAVGTPTAAIFGPTDPERWRPYGPKTMAIYDETLPCRPCHYKKTCTDRPCLTQLDPERIVAGCANLLAINSLATT
ncbi:MAG TPA: glycosyltransferase family 9 protein [Trichormus sp.]